MNVLKALPLAITLLLAGLLPATVAASADAAGAPASPEEVVHEVVTEALERIAEQREALATDREAGVELFNEQVLPWVDTDLMARFAMGPAARQADPADIERLRAALANRVANLYAGALQRYAGEAADFAEDGEVTLRTVTQDDNRAIVSAQVRGPHVDDLTLRIQLYKRDDRWRVFDIETSGVSILLVFRDALQSASHGGDVDAMIAALEEGSVNVEEAWEEETADSTDS